MKKTMRSFCLALMLCLLIPALVGCGKTGSNGVPDSQVQRDAVNIADLMDYYPDDMELEFYINHNYDKSTHTDYVSVCTKGSDGRICENSTFIYTYDRASDLWSPDLYAIDDEWYTTNVLDKEKYANIMTGDFNFKREPITCRHMDRDFIISYDVDEPAYNLQLKVSDVDFDGCTINADYVITIDSGDHNGLYIPETVVIEGGGTYSFNGWEHDRGLGLYPLSKNEIQTVNRGSSRGFSFDIDDYPIYTSGNSTLYAEGLHFDLTPDQYTVSVLFDIGKAIINP